MGAAAFIATSGLPLGERLDGERDERQQRECSADRRGGFRGDVSEGMTKDEQAEARNGNHQIAHHAEPCRRHVDEHDLDRLALLVVRRRDEERQIEPGGDDEPGEHREDRPQPVRQLHEARRIGEALRPALLVLFARHMPARCVVARGSIT